MSHSEIGIHSGVRIVEIDSQEVLPLDRCPACDSTDVRIIKTHTPIVNFLEPVRGSPYPTYAAEWCIIFDSNCQNCGAHWGRTEFTGELCSPDCLPYYVDSRQRIDKEFQ